MSQRVNAEYRRYEILDRTGGKESSGFECSVWDDYSATVVSSGWDTFDQLVADCNEKTIFTLLFDGDENASCLYDAAKEYGGLYLCDEWIEFYIEPLTEEEQRVLDAKNKSYIDKIMAIQSVKDRIWALEKLAHERPLSKDEQDAMGLARAVLAGIPTVTNMYAMQVIPNDGVAFVTGTTTVFPTFPDGAQLTGDRIIIDPDASAGYNPVRYKVEEKFPSEWGSPGWTIEGKPQTFISIKKADAAIDEFLRGVSVAVKLGLMKKGYDRDSFRVVEVKDEDHS
jgi:hypothetical protein